MRRNSLRSAILELAAEGMRTCEIAEALGCSHGNVSNTLRRSGILRLSTASLPRDKVRWLLAEARRARVNPSVMACAMLIDAIEEEMTKCSSTTP